MKPIREIQSIISPNFPHSINNELNQITTANVSFQVTDACNLACSYCYQINKHNHVMPLDTAKKFIDILLANDENTQKYIDTRNSAGLVIEFMGGEPFLQIDLIEEITNYFVKRLIELNHPWRYRWFINIPSNGTLYFDPRVQKFLNKHPNNLSLTISLDGNKELHDSCRKFPNGEGSYDIVVKAARDYLKKHPRTGSKMTISPDNIQYTYDALLQLINEGYQMIFANCIYEEGWTPEHATIWYNELKRLADYFLENEDLANNIACSIFEQNLAKPKDISDTHNWCGGNGNMIALDYAGNIYSCTRFMDSSLGTEIPPVIIGNVHEGGFACNKKCEDCINTLKSLNRINISTEECINCPVAEGCGWCTAWNYQDGKGNFFHRATYICIMHKARCLANVYYWNKYFRKHHKKERFKNWLPDEDALKIISQDELNLLKQLEQEE